MSDSDPTPTPDRDVEPGRDVLDRITRQLQELAHGTAALLADVAEASGRGLSERLAGLGLDTFVGLQGGLPGWEARRLVGAAQTLADLPWLAGRVAAGRSPGPPSPR